MATEDLSIIPFMRSKIFATHALPAASGRSIGCCLDQLWHPSIAAASLDTIRQIMPQLPCTAVGHEIELGPRQFAFQCQGTASMILWKFHFVEGSQSCIGVRASQRCAPHRSRNHIRQQAPRVCVRSSRNCTVVLDQGIYCIWKLCMAVRRAACSGLPQFDGRTHKAPSS